MEFLLILILVIPLIVALVVWGAPNNMRVMGTQHVLGSLVYSFVALMAIYSVANGNVLFSFDNMLFLDSVGGVFLLLIAVTGLLINVYSVKYMEWELEKAVKLGIPIVGVVPSGQERLSTVVTSKSVKDVRWNIDSIVQAIRDCAK